MAVPLLIAGCDDTVADPEPQARAAQPDVADQQGAEEVDSADEVPIRRWIEAATGVDDEAPGAAMGPDFDTRGDEREPSGQASEAGRQEESDTFEKSSSSRADGDDEELPSMPDEAVGLYIHR